MMVYNFTSGRWKDITSSFNLLPAARSSAAFAVDEVNRNFYMFGGLGKIVVVFALLYI